VALVHRIVGAYPVRADQATAEHAVVDALDAGEDPERMFAGASAIGAVILSHSSGARHPFAMGAGRFFGEKRWADDPEVWRKWIHGNGLAPAGLSASFGSERVEVASPRINGLPPKGNQ